MASIGFEEPAQHWQECCDEDFVSRARRGDERAYESLMVRYRALVEIKARAYFLVGAEHADVVQEGMIGLYKAIRDFNFEERAKFRPFAELCVTRQIITAVKTATRQKHIPLNHCVSLDWSLSGDDSDGTVGEMIPDMRGVSPEDIVLNGPVHGRLQRAIRPKLSDLERGVLKGYLEGKTYKQISAELRCHTKCIDNALQRIKRKLQNTLHSE